jgi:hypothetical protein
MSLINVSAQSLPYNFAASFFKAWLTIETITAVYPALLVALPGAGLLDNEHI